MKKIDFLSGAPRTFIFQKYSNKTSFGGFLTLIYLIILFLLAFVYIYNFEINNKYIISYGNYQKSIDKEEEYINDPNYNPTLFFKFDVVDFNRAPLSDNYVLLDYYTGNLIERNKLYEFNVSNIRIVVLYNCSDYQCSIKNKDLYSYNNSICYYFQYSKNYYEYNFEDDEHPVIMDKTKFTGSILSFSHDVGHILNSFWKVIKVTEEQGFLDQLQGIEKSSFGGDFYEQEISAIMTDVINAENVRIGDRKLNFEGIYKILYVFNSVNEFNNYIEYKRKKISIFDILANICSLSLTIYNGFQFVFIFFYSENFDNYKIIQKILTKSDMSFKKDINKIDDVKSDNSSPLLTELKNVDDVENEKEKDMTEKVVEIKDTKNSPLPKFHFFHFICNIFSSICFKKSKAQKCLDNFNEIIQKYNSVDSIIYNQLMIEILLKDYKWNNPNLYSIKNIELFDKLRKNIDGEI